MLALGIDDGLRHLGWVLADIGRPVPLALAAGCIQTKKRKGASVSLDDRRCRVEQYLALKGLPRLDEVGLVCTEAFSDLRSSGSNRVKAFSAALVTALEVEIGAVHLEATPKRIKLKATGSKAATKQGMIDAFRHVEGMEAAVRAMEADPATGRWEHYADAAWALLTCLDEPLARQLRKLP